MENNESDKGLKNNKIILSLLLIFIFLGGIALGIFVFSDNNLIRTSDNSKNSNSSNDNVQINDDQEEDTQKEDTQKEDTQKEDTQKKDTQKEDTQKEDTQKEDTKYKSYAKYEEIKLSNNSKWMVIADSGEDIDYVTILAYDAIQVNDESIGNDIMNNIITKYENSSLEKLVIDSVNNMGLKESLKTVNGYKARLITVHELLTIDPNWEKNEYGSYEYTGKSLNKHLLGMLTMTKIDCGNEYIGKCHSFYNTHVAHSDPNVEPRYLITGWAPGFPAIKPVINVYKKDIK